MTYDTIDFQNWPNWILRIGILPVGAHFVLSSTCILHPRRHVGVNGFRSWILCWMSFCRHCISLFCILCAVSYDDSDFPAQMDSSWIVCRNDHIPNTECFLALLFDPFLLALMTSWIPSIIENDSSKVVEFVKYFYLIHSKTDFNLPARQKSNLVPLYLFYFWDLFWLIVLKIKTNMKKYFNVVYWCWMKITSLSIRQKYREFLNTYS